MGHTYQEYEVNGIGESEKGDRFIFLSIAFRLIAKRHLS